MSDDVKVLGFITIAIVVFIWLLALGSWLGHVTHGWSIAVGAVFMILGIVLFGGGVAGTIGR